MDIPGNNVYVDGNTYAVDGSSVFTMTTGNTITAVHIAMTVQFTYANVGGKDTIRTMSDVSGATSLVVEVYEGAFVVGETLYGLTNESDLTTSATGTASLDSKTVECLAESYPDICTAAEIQIRYLWKNKMRFELTSTSKDGEQHVRTSVPKVDNYLQQEALDILMPYRRKSV